MTDMQKVGPIIEDLKEQAREILKAALGTQTLVAMEIGSQGNFPFEWQMPNNPSWMNPKSFSWIGQALKAGATPAVQSGVFTNEYTKALNAAVYTYSTADQAALNTANQNSTKQVGAFLSAWTGAGYTMPPGATPIDAIMTTIRTDWSTSDTTTLMEIRDSKNLNQLLANTPASGMALLPLLANVLNAWGAAVGLVNAQSMAQQMKQAALQAVQTPTAKNGGVLLDGGTTYGPGYKVAVSPQMIENALGNKKSPLVLTATQSQSDSSTFTFKSSAGLDVSTSILGIVNIGVEAQASYFYEHVAMKSSSVSITMEFPGVNFVPYGPTNYDASLGTGWFYVDPIQEAIKNGTSDVSGFKFSPDPGIDFSASGPFGFTTGVAISAFPTITIVATGADYNSIATAFSQSTKTTVGLFGINLFSASESSNSTTTKVDASTQTVTVKIAPPPDLYATNVADNQAMILGAVVDFPCA